MNYDLTLYYFLKRNLRVVYKTGIGDETRIRCPFCGDSQKDPTSAHMYINNKPPFKFYCFKCSSYGVVNDKLLNRIIDGESTYDISQYIKQKSKEYRGKDNIKLNSKRTQAYFNKKIDFSVTDNKYLEKLEYLNNRLGINLTEKDLEKFKIVLNIEDFFIKNGLNIKERFYNDKLIKQFYQLKKDYIGFLSADRNIIIFRNIRPDCTKEERYNNLRVFLMDDYETKKTYIVSTNIDIYKPYYKVIIAEGVIDILGIYHHLYSNMKDDTNYIFLANNGKSYSTTLKLLNSLSLLNNEITIYSDSDVGINLYRKLKKNSPEFRMNKITVYYNTKTEIGEDGKEIKYKDYGVTKDKIILSSKIIL